MPNIPAEQPDEQFLPLKPAALLDRIVKDPRLTPREGDLLRRLADMMASRIHFEFRHRAARLERLYDPFDPDRDTPALATVAPGELQQRLSELATEFRRLVDEGHYVELPRETIDECVELQHYGGIRVEADLDNYTYLAVYYRGARRQQRHSRSWRSAWRKRSKPCTVFSRAAVVVRTAEHPDHIHLKLFKDIVAEDLEMVLPSVRVRMRWIDGLKVGSGLVGSLATALWKVFTAIFSPVLFFLTLAGLLFAVFQAIMRYVSSRTAYMYALSANLYFQNLANNSSALSYLIDTAEAEKVKEMLLAYFILYVERQQDIGADELGCRVRQWIADEFRVNFEFHADHAVASLLDKGLAVTHAAEPDGGLEKAAAAAVEASEAGRRGVKVFDLPSSLRRMDAAWDDFYRYNSARPSHNDRIADRCWPATP